MHKYRIELVTGKDMMDFVQTVIPLKGEIKLTDGHGLCVNAKSILGAVATVEWNTLYCQSENDIGEHIAKYCIEDPEESLWDDD